MDPEIEALLEQIVRLTQERNAAIADGEYLRRRLGYEPQDYKETNARLLEEERLRRKQFKETGVEV